MLSEKLTAILGITDIYLFDQIIKGRVHKNSKILDAGCGSGRNLHILIHQGIPFLAVDEDAERIEELKNTFPKLSDQFLVSSLENLNLKKNTFDFIICNAVLHFARSHDHFKQMFEALINHLSANGILFIRMTSDIGLKKSSVEISSGLYEIPDGSIRYLLTKNMLNRLLTKHQLQLVDPLKSTVVEHVDLEHDAIRTMSTIVLKKKDII